MKNKILTIITISIILLSLNFISANVKFEQRQLNSGNGVIDNYIFLAYSTDKLNHFGITLDSLNYVPTGHPYEVPLYYSSSIKQWNQENPNNRVIACTLVTYKFNFRFFNITANGTRSYYPNFTRTIYPNFTEDNDVNDVIYFQLADNDNFFADFICYFVDRNYSSLITPVQMYVSSPTWDCKACQLEQSIKRKALLGDTEVFKTNTESIWSYIQKFIFFNFEIWLYLFWIMLIALLLFSIGMIFYGMYWIYLFLTRLIK
jgi:hypothetical protein